MADERETKGQQPPYKVPERIASATIYFLYGLSEKGSNSSVEDYLKERKFALTADLVQEGFTQEQIESAVNNGNVKVAPVFKKRVTDFYWLPESEEELDQLAARVERECGGDGTDMNVPAMGDVASVGAVLESQQLAMAALVYANHKGIVAETEIDRGIGVGPLFISKKNPMANLILENQSPS
ncbi:hypothetical protein A3A48_00770 [Candidatus Curtissbacteria bacterium RIFCSPLOWO2_01_FULL_37_9]|uniref:Uncharacterized protein n=1 Tax=Candidatus Curtissbacteria bacterium RIFCSPLOWO2_01_FULL_37_9 TaxID=1797724 RepID=A0A1F5GUJ0_9BACT|nr:MAG: hypothetical protein A3A48_00770 [Candidatus Curtissbacteria bacterium RIFCSPLOWO2_01_FULL_37_9]